LISFVENTAGSWLSYEKDLPKRLRFQKFIFEDIVPFSGEKFGTAKLTPIYSIYQQFLLNPSNVVDFDIIFLNRLVQELEYLAWVLKGDYKEAYHP
jgi:hypothetical protein